MTKTACRDDRWAGRRGYLRVDGVEIVPCDADLARLAYEAWRHFGKGRHPAGLNFGDCFSYALAKQRGEPLLFKGGDFSLTDLSAALAGKHASV